MTATLAGPLVITEPSIYDGIPEHAYHADPVPGGSLSSSGARKLLPPSCPAKYRWERDHPVAKKEFDYGSAAHKLALGTGPAIEVIDAACLAALAERTASADAKAARLYADTAAKGDPDAWTTAAAKAARDAARAAGRIPLLRKDYDQVAAMAAAIRAHPIAGPLFDPARDGRSEASLFWPDPDYGIWRRARLDRITGGVIGDYKTTTDASPAHIRKAIYEFGYHIQAPFYLDGAAALGVADPGFVLVFQEKDPPYLINQVQLDDDALAAGRAAIRRAMEIWRDCTEAGIWPGWPDDDIPYVSLPPWATRYEETDL